MNMVKYMKNISEIVIISLIRKVDHKKGCLSANFKKY